ncbi:hypothetical protein M0811_04194 [Anaeramoeba ignava]|uniref:UDENN FLCN/SMCR8-type domain-containing protein n=1 Tax=Anaeramoeba ignava TaxID=1746090 RepID=A0A9Q0LTW4_ANAIG|nr:hypothetical protein M0811_04194 [Anaeramoeba ignava]
MNDDFIVLTEFSQRKGPVTRMTIPPQSLDLKSFAIQIMTTDYQKEFDGTPVSDTQFVIAFNRKSMKNFNCAFVNHFTLLDIQARGFVRPICLSFVSNDMTKIMQNLPKMMKDFSEVTQKLKLNNIAIFIHEINKYLIQLEKTKEKKEKDPTVAEKFTLKTLHDYFIDMKNLKEKLLKSLKKKQFKYIQEKLQILNEQEMHNSNAIILIDDKITTVHLDRELRPIPLVCFPSEFEFTKFQLKSIHSKYSSQNYKLIHDNLLFPKVNPKSSLLKFAGIPLVNFNQKTHDLENEEVDFLTQNYLKNCKYKKINQNLLSEYLFVTETKIPKEIFAVQQKETPNLTEKTNEKNINEFFRSQNPKKSKWKSIQKYQKQIGKVIYSLLIGKPLVIRSSNEKKCTKFIESMKCFIPGEKFSNEKINWIISDLDLKILLSSKICGVSNELKIPKEIQQFIFEFSLETSSFIPDFELQSNLIQKIVNFFISNKEYSIEESFLTSKLFEIALNAYLYYHITFDKEGELQIKNRLDNQVQDQHEKILTHFFDGSVLLKHDKKILKCLSIFISKQQLNFFRPNFQENVFQFHLDFLQNN